MLTLHKEESGARPSNSAREGKSGLRARGALEIGGSERQDALRRSDAGQDAAEEKLARRELRSLSQ